VKIAILGYSGSGKSTLAQKLAAHHALPVLHLDTVHHLPGWQVRDREESAKIVSDFLDANAEGGWVIDGTYSKLSFERRLEEADLILLLLFNRFRCLYRVCKRYHTYKGKSRPDMAEGCAEKIDGEFLRWILWKGRTKLHRQRFRGIQTQYKDKVTVLKSQRQIDAFERECGL